MSILLDLYVTPDYECSGVTEHYAKVSGVVSVAGRQGQDIFSVIVNKKTANIQAQYRVDFQDARRAMVVLFGNQWRSSFRTRGLQELCHAIDAGQIQDDDAKFVDLAMWDLRRACRNTVMRDSSLTRDEQNEIISTVSKLVNEYRDFRNHAKRPAEDLGKMTQIGAANPTAPAQAAQTPVQAPAEEEAQAPEQAEQAAPSEVEWTDVPDGIITSMDTAKMEEIINDITKSADGVARRGATEYRFNRQKNALQYRGVPTWERTEAEAAAVPETPKRKTVRMARMMDAGGMTEFITGGLYRIKQGSELSFNGKNYLVLYTMAGEERSVSASRVSVGEVYDEPPAEEAAEAAAAMP